MSQTSQLSNFSATNDITVLTFNCQIINNVYPDQTITSFCEKTMNKIPQPPNPWRKFLRWLAHMRARMFDYSAVPSAPPEM